MVELAANKQLQKEGKLLYREIKKKKLILENRLPYSREISQMIGEMNLLDWVYTSLRLDGSQLSREAVGLLLEGEIALEATLEEHAFVDRLVQTIKKAQSLASFHSEIDLPLINRFYGLITGIENPHFRKGNPVLIALSYTPPHAHEVKEQMDILLNWLATDKEEGNILRKASLLHHRFLEIYPFECYSEVMARFLFYYLLILEGYPPFPISLTESAYNDTLSTFFRKEDIEPFYMVVERCLLHKMEVLMQLTQRD
jgi:Fic family protein